MQYLKFRWWYTHQVRDVILHWHHVHQEGAGWKYWSKKRFLQDCYLKVDKQYKKDANEAKIYIDGIKARQTTRRTLTPSYVFNVCTTSHICKWDRDPNVRPPVLCRVFKQTCAGDFSHFIQTLSMVIHVHLYLKNTIIIILIKYSHLQPFYNILSS